MAFPQPLLADLQTIIQAIILLVILASGAVRMFRESQEVQRRAERPRPRPQPERGKRPERPRGARRDVVQGRAAPEQKPQQQEAIRSEVEEFLRRVGQENHEDHRAERRKPERRPRIEVIDEAESGFDVDERPRQARQRSVPRVQQPATPTTPPPVRPADREQKPELPETAAPKSERMDRTAAGAYETENFNRDAFSQRASLMGEDLSQTDERLEARLHQKFDQRLGRLSALRSAREAADLKFKGEQNADTHADDLLEMLSTPQGVQNAVILTEMLNRPTDRW